MKDDPLGALRLRLDLRDPDAADGPLAGRRFAVKDVFDVEGHTASCGNPDWLATHDPARTTAPVVRRCLAAGGHLVGYAVCDELTYSLFGENVHYGTPVNPAGPGRVPGGSSSGSAAAVAGGLVDFALGTDTAGSVVVPASYCGVFGLRPTHGRVPVAGVVALAPSFDTVGWHARDAALLERVGQVVFAGDDVTESGPIRRLLRLDDAFALADPAARPALERAAALVTEAIGPVESLSLDDIGRGDWLGSFDTLRPPEIWAQHGSWISSTHPRFGPQIAERLALVEHRARADTTAAWAFREGLQESAGELLGDDAALLLPTVPTTAPERGVSPVRAPALRERTLRLTCIAPMLGLPALSLPLARVDGLPLGLSLIGPRHGDRALLELATRVEVPDRSGVQA